MMARFALFLLSAGLFSAVARAEACSTPQRLVLHVQAPAPPRVTEHIVAAADIRKLSASPERHALMALSYRLVSQVAIVRDPADDRAEACGPLEVVVTFGVGRRDVFLAREAASSPCIRSALLAHEREHDRITTRAARAFVDRRRAQLLRVIAAALGPPAGDPTLSTSFQDAVLRALRQLSAEFGADIRGPLRTAADTPAALAGLAAACKGALGALDRAVRQGTAS